MTLDELKAWVTEHLIIKCDEDVFVAVDTLLKNIDKLNINTPKKMLNFKESDAKLCDELCTILLPHVGKTGLNESAIEVLNRLLTEKSKAERRLAEHNRILSIFVNNIKSIEQFEGEDYIVIMNGQTNSSGIIISKSEATILRNIKNKLNEKGE